MKTADALGRATFHHIEHRAGIRPTPREIRWLKFIEKHGAQSSLYLHELTRDTHRDPDTTRRQLQKLRAGGYLFCPKQQRATENAQFNPYIYDLTDRARFFLEEQALAEETVLPTGHWVHGYMTSCITASIDIAAQRAGMTTVPAHAVLQRAGTTLGVSIDGKRLIPDQLFGLDYGSGFRFFCVEADRGTEPKSSTAARKSYRASLEAYTRLIAEGRYKDHYGLKTGLMLLFVFSAPGNEQRFLRCAREMLGSRATWVLTRTIPDFHGSFRPPALLTELFDQPWNRAGLPPFRIDRP